MKTNEKESQLPEKKNDAVSIKSNTALSKAINLEQLKEIEALVEVLKDSSLADQFMETIYEKREDGTAIEGTGKRVFKKGDMVMCIGLGLALGIDPYVALSYGRALNIKSVKKIERGKKLGLDYATSLEQIYIWGEGSKEIMYTSIHIVNASLTKVGVTREILQDGTTPTFTYYNAETGDEIEFDSTVHRILPNTVANMNVAEKTKVFEAIKGNNQIPVFKSKRILVAEVRFTRFNRKSGQNEVITTKYTSQMATDAGLLRGINSQTGEEVKGKDNWNSHPATHLIKMCIMIGGRIIASDVLQGIYIPDEISNIKTVFKDSDVKPDGIEDAELID